MRVAVLVAALAAAALGGAGSAGSHPPAPFGAAGAPIRGPIHSWLHQAKAPLVRGRLRILIGACPATPLFVGCIYTKRPRTIYLSPVARRPRAVLYHELGHSFDLRVLRPRHRAKFKRLMGIRTRGWFSSTPPASEWFADAYTACAERRRLRRVRAATPYGYRATPARHRRACALIRDAAAADRRRGPRRPARPPADAPRVAEPQSPPPSSPPGSEPHRPPSGPYQPPGVPAPDELLPGCNPVEGLVAGCDAG